MTSEQIKNLCLQVSEMGTKAVDGSNLAFRLMQIQFIAEVALQLSLANEREAKRDADKAEAGEIMREFARREFGK